MKRYHPDTDPATIPDAVLASEAGRRNAAKRKKFGAGTGRPKSPRCACGRFTLAAAAKSAHVCPPAQISLESVVRM